MQSKRLVIYIVLLVMVVAAMFALRGKDKGTPIVWLTDLEEAGAQAKSEDKPLMVYFYADDNDACSRIERTTFSEKAVHEEADKFVCVRLDGGSLPALSKRYRIVLYPTVVFTSPGGHRLSMAWNYQTPEQMLDEMRGALKLAASAATEAAPGTSAPEREAPVTSPVLPPKDAGPSRGETE